ncbi:DUF2478 domain-containing protein [Rhodopseudomonas palustris]|uniref:DUF2478 domain-containing protein n=1 Tax=Rhodopseudomonas palustris (strain BisB18) TaxID=316056 RepID=Q20YE3_RHOPB
MFDSQCDLAALVYDKDQDPDAILRGFAADLASRGVRAVGLVQTGHHEVDRRQLTATLVHSGEQLQLLQDLGALATGCRLDVGQLLAAGAQIEAAIGQGADLLIINRFGKLECEGKGLCYLIDRALSADIPVLIAVPDYRFDDWIAFADGMSVRLKCNRVALEAWWSAVSTRSTGLLHSEHVSVCEALK